MTSLFARSEAPAQASGSPFDQKAAAPAQQAAPASNGGRFATKRERPDQYPTAADLMPSSIKGTDGALVIIRVDSVKRGLTSQSGGTYDAFDTKTWILEAPRGLPAHVLEAGEERDGAFYLPEMRWSGAGLVRDLEGLLDNRQLFVGRVSSYKNQFGKASPEFAMAADAELAQAEAYLAKHPEVDFPATSKFAQASA